MKSKDIKISLYVIAAAISLMAALFPLRAQFILKEDKKEEKPAADEKISRETIYPYPSHMAFDIKAEKIQGLEKRHNGHMGDAS